MPNFNTRYVNSKKKQERDEEKRQREAREQATAMLRYKATQNPVKREAQSKIVRPSQTASRPQSTNPSTSSRNSLQTSQRGSQSPSAVNSLFKETARKATGNSLTDRRQRYSQQRDTKTTRPTASVNNVEDRRSGRYRNDRREQQSYVNTPRNSVQYDKGKTTIGDRVADTLKGSAKQWAGGHLSSVGTAAQFAEPTVRGIQKTEYRDPGETGYSLRSRKEADLRQNERTQNIALKEGRDLRTFKGRDYSDKNANLQAFIRSADNLIESGSRDIERAKKGTGKIGSFAIDTMSNMAQMGGDLAANVALPGLGMVALGMRSAGMGSYQARQQGLDVNEQALHGLIDGVVEMGSEAIFGGVSALQKTYGKGMFSLADKLGWRTASSEMVRRMFKTDFGQALATHLSRLGAGMLEEGTEELIADVFEPALKYVFTKANNPDYKFEGTDLKQMGYDFLLGAMTAGVLGGGSTVAGVRADSQAFVDGQNYAQDLVNRARVQGREGMATTNAEILGGRLQSQMERGIEASPYQIRTLQEAVGESQLANAIDYEKRNAERYQQAVDEGRADRVQQQGTYQEYEGYRRRVDDTLERNYERARSVMGEDASEESVNAVRNVITGSTDNYDIDTVLTDNEAKKAVETLTGTKLSVNNQTARNEIENIALTRQIQNRDAILQETHESIRTEMSKRGGQLFDENYDRAVETLDVPNGANIYDSFFSRFYTDGTVQGADFDKSYNRIMGSIREDFGDELAGKIGEVFNMDFAQKVFAEGQMAQATYNAKYQGKALSLKASENPAGFTYEDTARAKISDRQAELLTKFAERANIHIRLVDSIAGGSANGSYENGVIMIAADSTNKLVTVAKHELTHHIRSTSPELYQKLEDFIFNKYYEWDADALENKIREYQERGYNMTAEKIKEEIVADASEAFFTDEGSIQAVVNHDRGLAQAIHDGIKTLLDTLLDLQDSDNLGTRGYGDFLDDIDILREAEKMWLDALNDSVQKTREASASTETASETDAETKHSLKEQDQAYMDAVNNNKMALAQSMVDEKASSIETIAKDSKGKPIHLFHGTNSFGFTVFKDSHHDVPFIYTSTDRTVSAHYAGDNHYASTRPIGTAYKTGNSVKDILENAKNVLGADMKVMTKADKKARYDQVREEALEVADRLDELESKYSSFNFYTNGNEKMMNAVAWVENQFWTIRDGDYQYNFDEDTEENAEWRNSLEEDVERFKDNIGTVREYYNENYKNLNKGEKALLSYLIGYDLGDVAIDIEYGMLRVATEEDLLSNENGGNIIKPSDLKENMDRIHNIGAYDMYGDLGDNPFEFDAKGSQFWAVEVPEMGEGYFSTDQICKWASENGYTSVIMHNIYDYGDKADNYVFFNSNQLKSADPVTYDDSGNVIPLSERFNAENEDIRFSLKEPVEETKDLLAVHNLKAEDLEGSLDLGGFPMPSIAIIKADAGHDAYGEYSAIFDKSTIDPSVTKKNVVYGGDAWTPTFPSVQHKANEKVRKKISNLYYGRVGDLGYDVMRPLQRLANDPEDVLDSAGGEAELKDRYKQNIDMMRMFLRMNGKDVQDVVNRTEDKMSDYEMSISQHFIDALGEDAIREFERNPRERINWGKEHKAELEQIYGDYMKKEWDFSDQDVKETLADTKLFQLVSFVRNAMNLLNNGTTTVRETVDNEATNRLVEEKAKAEGYDKWVDDLLSGIEEKKGIRNSKDVFTPSGSRRSWETLHDEINLVNIVRAMAAQDNGETFLGSSLKAVAQKKYRNISEIKADKGRLRTVSPEEYKELMDGFAARETEIINRIDNASPTYESNPFIRHGEIRSAIVDNVRRGLSKKAFLEDLKKWANTKGATAKDVDDIFDLVRDVANIPTGYFEAKPKRPVTFNEVKALLAPSDAPADLISKLQDEGVNVVQYEAGNEADRVAKLNQAADETKTKFSLKEDSSQTIASQNTISKLEEQVKDLKAEFKRTNLKTANQKDVRVQAGRLIRRHDSNLGTQKSLMDTFNKIFNLYKEKGTDAFDEVYEIAKDEAVNIVNNISVLHNEGSEEYKAIKEYLRTTPIEISEDMKRNITDYESFRKRNFGRLKLKNGETSNIDNVYMELMEMFPGQFTEDYVNPADQLNHIVDVLDNYAPIYENLDGASEEMQDYVVDIAADIMETAYNLQTKKTFADKKYEEKVRAVEKARQKALESRDKALEKQKQRYEDKISAMKEHNKEMRANRKARREDSEARTKLLKIARRLDRLKTTEANRQQIDALIGELDLVAKGMTDKSLEKLTDLQAWYEDQKTNDPDFIADSNIENKLKRLSKTHIKDMTLEEVRDLYDVLSNIENELATEKKLIDSEIKKEIYEAGRESIRNINRSQGIAKSMRKLDTFFISGTLSPLRQIRRVTGYNDNDPLYIATKELADGQRKMLQYQMDSWKAFDRFMNDKKFINSLNGKSAEEIEVTGTKDGEPFRVKITPDIRMAMYLAGMNDDNLRHMRYGGITLPDIKLYKKGKISEAMESGETVKFSPSQIKEITSHMSEREKEFAQEAYKYYNITSPQAINEVSEVLKGYSLARVDNYFPIHTDSDYLTKEFESMKFDGTIEGMGFLKERVKASNPILMTGLVDTLTKSIDMNSKYVGLAIPVRNFNKILGVKDMAWDEEGNAEFNGSVKRSISKKWGKSVASYIEKFMTDLQNGRKTSDEWGSVFSKARSRYAGAVLTLNASVAIKQAASYPTAAAVLGWAPLAKAMGNVGKVDLDLIAKYTPLQWYRSKGFSTTELGDITSSRASNIPTPLNWIQGMDVLTTRKLWKASEYYVRQHNKNLKTGTDEYYKAVADIYNRVIEETQPNYTTMQRPGLLRSDNEITLTLNMFKTQPYQNFNILFDAFGNFAAKRNQYKADKSSESKKALKEANKDMQNAVTSQIAQLAVFAAMTSLWALFRRKDDKYRDEEGKLTIFSYMKKLGEDMVSNLFADVPLGADLYSMASSTLTGDTYYGFTSVTDSAITDVMDSFKNGAVAIGDWLEYGRSDDPEKKPSSDLYKETENVISSASRAMGIPASNLRNLVNGIYGWAAISADGEYIGTYEAQKMTFAREKDMKANLFRAYQNDKQAYEKLRKMMIEDGFSEEKLDDYIKAQRKEHHSEEEQKSIDKSMSTLEASSIWQDASDDDKKRYENITEKLALGIDDSTTGSITKLAGTDGLTEEQVILYKLALKKVDKPSESGKLGSYTNAEKEEALKLLAKEFNLTQKQKNTLKG